MAAEQHKYHRHRWEKGALKGGEDILRKGEVRTVIAVIEDTDEKGDFVHVHFGDGKPFSLRDGDEYRTPAEPGEEGDDDTSEIG